MTDGRHLTKTSVLWPLALINTCTRLWVLALGFRIWRLALLAETRWTRRAGMKKDLFFVLWRRLLIVFSSILLIYFYNKNGPHQTCRHVSGLVDVTAPDVSKPTYIFLIKNNICEGDDCIACQVRQINFWFGWDWVNNYNLYNIKLSSDAFTWLHSVVMLIMIILLCNFNWNAF